MNRESARRKKWEYFRMRNQQSGGYLLRKSLGNVLYKLARTILLFGLCMLIIQPLFNKLSISFMKEKDLFDSTVISIPRNFTTDNFKLVAKLMDFWKALINTVGMSFLIAAIQVMFCTFVGYGFARFSFPFKKFWFACVIFVIVVPPQTIMSSLYLRFRFFDVFGILKMITGNSVNMLNSMAPYLLLSIGCMGLKNGLYIFMLRQYFRGIPKELEEAAYVDGCGNLATFFRVMLPDATPMITSCFLFSFVWQWTDSFYSNLFLRKYTLLPSALSAISDRLNAHLTSKASVAYTQSTIATGVLMAIIPLLIIYIVAQKGFVESLSQSGIKM